MKRTFINCALFILALGISASAIYLQSARSTMSKSENFTDRTEVKKYELPVKESMKNTRVKISARVASGSIRWVLRDPNSEARLTGEGTEGNVSGDSGNMTPIDGTWTLEVELKNASGKYEIKWTAQ